MTSTTVRCQTCGAFTANGRPWCTDCPARQFQAARPPRERTERPRKDGDATGRPTTGTADDTLPAVARALPAGPRATS